MFYEGFSLDAGIYSFDFERKIYSAIKKSSKILRKKKSDTLLFISERTQVP